MTIRPRITSYNVCYTKLLRIFGVILSFVWPPIGSAIQSFSQWAAYQNPVLAFGIYGVVERSLVPFGLHHIWNVPFQMQIGEYVNAAGQVFHGDIPRYMAGDQTAGMLSGGFLFKMYGLPAAAIAIWHSAKPDRITSYNVCYTKLLRTGQ